MARSYVYLWGGSRSIDYGYFHPTKFDSSYAYGKVSLGTINLGNYEETYELNLLSSAFTPGIDFTDMPIRVSYQNSAWKVTALEDCLMGSNMNNLSTYKAGQSMSLNYSQVTSYVYFSKL